MYYGYEFRKCGMPIWDIDWIVFGQHIENDTTFFKCFLQMCPQPFSVSKYQTIGMGIYLEIINQYC